MRNVLILAVMLLALPGCATLQDWHYDQMNCLRSEWAWASCSKNPLYIVCPSHYGAGWKQGYLSKSTGGSGHAPTLPPEKYWSSSYQSPKGQDAIAAWYGGFQDGALFADQRGAGQYHYLRTYGTSAQNQPNASNHGSPSGGPTEAILPAQSPEWTPQPPLELLPAGDSQGSGQSSPGTGLPVNGSAGSAGGASESATSSGRADPALERLPPCYDAAGNRASPADTRYPSMARYGQAATH